MLRHIDSKDMGRSFLGWLDSRFHFSFAGYYNPDNIHFGALRVVNDDLVEPGTGFDTHPHADMEILSYVVDGELTHADSMGNQETLTSGQVQYMSAGTGVLHSEHNWGNNMLRFLQIWIFPDEKGHKPNYGDFRFKLEDRYNTWLPIATYRENTESKAPIKINADINAYATIIDEPIEFKVEPGRQAYLVLIEGEAEIGGDELKMRDGMEIVEEDITIIPKERSHILIIEMKKM